MVCSTIVPAGFLRVLPDELGSELSPGVVALHRRYVALLVHSPSLLTSDTTQAPNNTRLSMSGLLIYPETMYVHSVELCIRSAMSASSRYPPRPS